MLVTLTDRELEYCREVGNKRYSLCRENNLTQLRIDDSALDVETLGVQGELVFAKVFGFDYPIARAEPDGGVDFQEGDLTIDVKAASRDNYNLIFRSLESFKSQIAVLVVKSSDNTFRLAGVISKNKFAEAAEPMQHRPESYLVRQKDLYPSKLLWDEIGKRRFA